MADNGRGGVGCGGAGNDVEGRVWWLWVWRERVWHLRNSGCGGGAGSGDRGNMVEMAGVVVAVVEAVV